jgi:hypothetical protein
MVAVTGLTLLLTSTAQAYEYWQRVYNADPQNTRPHQILLSLDHVGRTSATAKSVTDTVRASKLIQNVRDAYVCVILL